MKIIIAGSGKVGTTLIDTLAKENHDITVIDIDEQRIQSVSDKYDVMAIVGDAKSATLLKEADASKSDLLIAVTDNDEENLTVCLIAKNLGVKNTIARVRNPIYAESIKLIQNSLGLSMAINPELEAANEILRTLRFKSAEQVETFAKSRMEILTCFVQEGTPICNVRIKDLYSKIKANVFICALKRDNEVIIPNGDFEIQAGDTLSFVATAKEARGFFKKMGYDTGKVKNLAIIGGGKLGYNLAKKAVDTGIPVKLIDNDKDRCKELNELLPSAEIVYGSGNDTSLLEEEEIFNYSAVAVLTDDDAENTLIAMYLNKHANNSKIIIKIKRSDFEDLIYGLELGSVFNPKYITADHIIRYVRAMNNVLNDEVQSLCHVIDNKVEVLEFRIGEEAKCTGKELRELKLRKDLLIAAIYRKGVGFTPHGEDTIEKGDTVLVITTHKGISKLADIFE